MSTKLMSVDLHTHSVSHKYFFTGYTPATIDLQDKKNVEEHLRSNFQRGLGALAVTDHDMLATGLYARDLAARKGFAIKVIPGMECQLMYQGMYAKEQIHILAIGIEEPPAYTKDTPIEYLAERVRKLGGFTILAHPVTYTDAACARFIPHVDGIEEFNGARYARLNDGYYKYAEQHATEHWLTRGSDYHYKDMVLLPDVSNLSRFNVDEQVVSKLAGY